MDGEDVTLESFGRSLVGFILVTLAADLFKVGGMEALPTDKGDLVLTDRVSDWLETCLTTTDPWTLAALVPVSLLPDDARAEVGAVVREVEVLLDALFQITRSDVSVERKVRHVLRRAEDEAAGQEPPSLTDELLGAIEAGWSLAELGVPLVDLLIQEGRFEEAEAWRVRALVHPDLDDRRRSRLERAAEDIAVFRLNPLSNPTASDPS